MVGMASYINNKACKYNPITGQDFLDIIDFFFDFSKQKVIWYNLSIETKRMFFNDTGQEAISELTIMVNINEETLDLFFTDNYATK